MKILLTGKNGQLGFELQRTLAPLGELVAVGQEECDLADPENLRKLLADIRPDVIVNPAAYTAVDKAETERDLAHAVNAAAPEVLGRHAAQSGAWVVHYSTDYVFDGAKTGPYTEADAPNPQSVYGASKLAGEQALQASGARHLILRTSWVVGAHGGNFAKTMLRLAAERDSLNVVADQFGAPTSAGLLADVTAQIIGRHLLAAPARAQGREPLALQSGIYHATASGETTWHAYARYVIAAAIEAGRAIKATPDKIRPIPASQYPLPAARPSNSRLDTGKFRAAFGLVLPPWQHGLDHILQQIL